MLSANLFIDNSIRLVRSPIVLLGFTIVLLALEFLIPVFYDTIFHLSYSQQHLSGSLFFLIATTLFFFLIPWALTRYLYRKDLASLGLAFPTNKILAVGGVLLGIGVLLPIIIYMARLPIMHQYYRFNPSSMLLIWMTWIIIGPLYYLFEEFFFRGFLFLHLYQKIGSVSYWISDIIFVMAHITKPVPEIIFAFPAGMVLALVARYTRSILPSACIHYVLGVTLLVMNTMR